MNYVVSDIHGFYSKYLEFLNHVNFSNDDMLYIIGDIVNRGNNGIELLQDIMKRPNVLLIKGNHELMIMESLNEIIDSDPCIVSQIITEEVNIMPIEQEDTLISFSRLSKQEQSNIIDYLSSLPLYQEIYVNSQRYLLVHAGLPEFSNIDINLYSEEELLFGPHDFSINHYDNTFIIVGHIPTRFIKGAVMDRIYTFNDSICLDCGLGFGGQLGVLCLDTGTELYFK